jgi:hypothetical protein
MPCARRARRCDDLQRPDGLQRQRGCDAKCRIRLRDGVTCEACHGPASAWLEPHTEKKWDASCSIPLGMRDTSRPEKAVEACLDCHLGSEKNVLQRVAHDLLAAGHPPLAFEVDAFATDMPAHWTRHARNEGWFDGRAWAVGQVAGAQRAARLFMDQGDRPGCPDFAAYDCQSCHHEISSGAWDRRKSDGRPKADGARRPGVKAVVEVVAKEHAPGCRGYEAMAKAAAAGPGAPGVREAAGRAQKTTESLLRRSRRWRSTTVLLARAEDRRARRRDRRARLPRRSSRRALESLVDARCGSVTSRSASRRIRRCARGSAMGAGPGSRPVRSRVHRASIVAVGKVLAAE